MQENPICDSCGEKTELLLQLKPNSEDKRWFGCQKCDRVYEYYVNPSTGDWLQGANLLLVGTADHRRQQKGHWERHWK